MLQPSQLRYVGKTNMSANIFSHGNYNQDMHLSKPRRKCHHTPLQNIAKYFTNYLSVNYRIIHCLYSLSKWSYILYKALLVLTVKIQHNIVLIIDCNHCQNTA